MANFIGKRVSLVTESRTYEGYVHLLDVQTQQISLQKVVIADTGKKLNGLQTFFQEDIIDIIVLPDECKKVESDDKLVQGKEKRENGPRILCNKYAPEHLRRLQDFEQSSHLLRNVVTEGESIATEDTQKPANRSSDYDSSSDQENLDCEDCFYISKLNQRFHDVVNHLKDQSEIGVSLNGVCIGRNGKLSLIQVATTKDVFIFDIMTLGPNCWELGLKAIFEDPRISKVMHDCRFPSDMLHHQYDVKLINIFDTQVADVFVYRLYHHGDWPKWVNGLSCSLYDHLNIPADMTNNLKVRENLKKEDQEVWLTRPLPKNLLKIAVKEVVHLLQLRHVLSEKMMGEYIAGVDVYLSYVREASKEDVKKYQMNNHKLPVPFENLSGLLVNRDSHRYNRHRYNRGPSVDHDYNKDSVSGFRENCRGFVGTDIKYSNSSIWHQNCASDAGFKANHKSPAKLSEDITRLEKDKGFMSEPNSLERKSPVMFSEPEYTDRKSSPKLSEFEMTDIKSLGSLPEPDSKGRKSLLNTPLSQLEELRKSLLSQGIQSHDNTSANHNHERHQTNQISSNNLEFNCVNQATLNDGGKSNSSSEKYMSLGQLIRSKIKYSDSDSDLDLVPAGRMMTAGKLHKLRDKRRNQIDQMGNTIGQQKNNGEFNNSFSPSSSRMNTSLTSHAQSPHSQNVSFHENYVTAPSTPSLNQSGLKTYYKSPSVSSPFSPEVENFNTAPTTPAMANLTTSQQIQGGNNWSFAYETDSSGFESQLLSKDLATKLKSGTQLSPQMSSDSDCPTLFSFNHSTEASIRYNLSPQKNVYSERSPKASPLGKGVNSLNSSESASNGSSPNSSLPSDGESKSLLKLESDSPVFCLNRPYSSPNMQNKSSHLESPISSQAKPLVFNINNNSRCSPINRQYTSSLSKVPQEKETVNRGVTSLKPTTSNRLKSTTSKLERLKILKEAAKKKSPKS